jgi:hypothetical protein
VQAPEDKVNIYSDESGTCGVRYLSIGGLWVPYLHDGAIRSAIRELRDRHSCYGEFKWTKVSRNKLHVYQDLITTFTSFTEIDFKCMVVDTHQVDHCKYSGGDEELGFYKFYYLLISRNLAQGYLHYLYTDQRHNRKQNRLQVLKIVSNRWFLKEHRLAMEDPLKTVEARDSKSDDLIQLADVLLGAVGASWNGLTRSVHKLQLMRYIQSQLPVASLSRGTARNNPRITIWPWRPQ